MRQIVLMFLSAWMVSIGLTTSADAQFRAESLTDLQLRDRVHKALRNGTDYLRRRQNGDGSWGRIDEEYGEHHVGLTSLAVMALINSDVPVTSDEVQGGLNYLRNHGEAHLKANDKRSVYETSLMIMALCAAEDPQRDGLRINNLATALIETQCQQGQNSGLWGYRLARLGGSPGSNGEDRSNGQFAVLALRDAAYAGVPIDRSVWQRTHEHWQRLQRPDGGWGYHPEDAARGSMTVAGLSTLAITTRMLADDSDVGANGRPDCCAEHPVSDAFQKGRRWMATYFDVFKNPGSPNWHYYYLYGLERAGRLSSVRFFGQHDWYRMGARYLVSNGVQQADGSWVSRNGAKWDLTMPTSYAMLFLSKGLSRVVVNKLDYSSTGLEQDVHGPWNRHPLDIPNLIELIDQSEGWPPRLTSQVLSLSRLTDDSAVLDMNQAPVLYISGKDAPQLTDQHIRWLRDYVDEGGFIFAVANCEGGTFDAGFREIVERMFPLGEASLQRLQPDHPIFRSEHPLNADSIELHGVDFGCRTAIVYAPEDHACLWQKWMKHDPRDRKQDLTTAIIRSTRVGVNVLAYATGREPPEKLNEAMVRKDDAEMRVKRGLLEIAQLRHDGGWDTAPKALTNLLRGLSEIDGIAVSPERQAIPITLPELTRFPIAYMHGRYRFQLAAQERDALRDYLSRGTMLFADACCGSPRFDQSFRDLMQQMYPDNPLELIPADHELYAETTGFKIEDVKRRKQVPGQGNASMKTQTVVGPPLLYGVKIEGRYVVIYSPYDISCALENQASLACDGYLEEDALRLGINIVLYSMLQNVSATEWLAE
ncbi:MAG: DUF4159 domain-containing protein [Planctomycetaceae bacterium]